MLSSELRDIVQEYIESKISLEQLEDRIVPHEPFFLKDPASPDADLIATIELFLAEISDNVATEEEFRNALRVALKKDSSVLTRFTFPPGSATETITTVSPNLTTEWPDPSTVVITIPAVATG